MKRSINSLLFCAIIAVFLPSEALHGQGTAFTYQGRLNDSGSPANGTYVLRFAIYDAVSGGSAVSGALTNSAVAVSNGLLVVTLDFGPGIFTGPDRWLDIGVRTNGSTNAFTLLVPRQHLTPVPYAIFANSASNLLGSLAATQLSGTLPSSQLGGTYSGLVIFNNGGDSFSGTFSGDGSSLGNLNASQLASGTVADARLSANVALLNANQTFSGANALTNWGNSFVGSFFGNGLVGWIVQTGTTVQATIDTGYLLTNAQVVKVTLPASPNVGDIVRVAGAGAGGWKIAQNAGQSVLGNFSSFAKSLWTLTSASYGVNWYAIASSADGSHLAAVVYGGGIYTSTDSGATWSGPNGNNASWRSIASSADGIKLVAVVYGGGIYTNSGTSWTVSGAPSTNWYSVASSADGSKLVAAVYGGRIYTSTSSGGTWTQQTSAPTRNWVSVASSADGNNLVAAISGGAIYTSANAGVTWTQQAGAGSRNWISVASSADGGRLVAVVSVGGIYTSTNSGVAWTQTSAPSTNWVSVASSSDGGKLAAAVSGGRIYISSSWGETWAEQTYAPRTNWVGIASSSDGDKLAAAVNNGGIYTAQTSTQTTTTTGTNGYLAGSQGSAVELQYIGNGRFMPVSSAGTIWAY